jgi:hypothetical protein
MSLLLMAAQFGPRFLNSGKPIYRYSVKVEITDPMKSGAVLQWFRDHDFDIAGVNWKKQQVEVITTREGIALLNQNHYYGRILEEQIPGASSRITFDPRYLSAAKIEERLKELHVKYPELTRLEQLGTSAEGRAIWGLLISSTPQAQDSHAYEKPSILIDGLHHAREIMTPEVVMDVAETFLQSPTAEHRALLSRWNIWLVPMLNVDGSNLVWTQDSWWRKNVRLVGNRISGVDVNRNYPYKWSACNGSSGSESSETYRGPSAGSEAETQALSKLAESIRPTAYLSYHSYSELVLYPYGCTEDLTGESQLHDKIGHELANLLPSDSNKESFYTPGPPWQILYGVDGDSMSYMYSEFGATSFTFEINQEFQPDYELRQPTVEKHRKAWTYFMNRIDQNLLTLKVIDGKTNTASPAMVSVSTIAQVKGEKPFRTNQTGNFFKILDPGTYTLSVRLNDGREKEVTVKMTGQPLSETVTVL